MGAVLTSACLVGGAAVGLIGSNLSGAGAETVGPINFESGYTLGSVNAQNGWSSTGGFDEEVVDNSTIPAAPASFGTRSFRISDAITSGAFGNQTFTPSTANAAGEPGADTGGYPVGTLQPRFTASLDFASTTPAVEQSGMHLSISPDRGDGARMSYVRIDDTPGGYDLFFDGVQDAAVVPPGGDLSSGCDGQPSGNFTEVPVATGITRTAHKLTFDMQFVAGPNNDVVKIYLDGVLKITGGSWEDYYRYCTESGGGTGGPLANKSRIVRNLELREGGANDPGNSGQGLLIDGMTVASSTPAPPVVPTGGPLANPPRLVGAVPVNNGARVNWKGATVPSGGSAIAGYVVTPYLGSVAQPAHSFGTTATTQTITGLTNGKAYSFKVASVNAAGTGAQSKASAKATAGAPGRPGAPTVTKTRAGVLKVTFKTPMHNGAVIRSVTATCTSSNGGVTQTHTKKGPNGPIGVKSLTAGKSYKCTVFATNRRGNGPRSSASAAVTA